MAQTPAETAPPTPTLAGEPGTRTGSDGAFIDRIRRLVAAGDFSKAEEQLDAWLAVNANSSNGYLPEAYLLRGDAKLGQDDEFQAMYDYEEVISGFPSSEYFVTALERELEVAKLYFGGRRKKMFGVRIDSGRPIAEETVMRINERLPGSRLAEKALMMLADFYYERRDLRMAAETYDTFVKLFPESSLRKKAMQRLIFSNVAQFKGTDYDASTLNDAKIQIENFRDRFPADADAAGLGDELMIRLDENSAMQMFNVANWYDDRGDWVSAKATLNRLVRRYPSTKAAEQGFDLLVSKGWAPELSESIAPASLSPEKASPTNNPTEAAPQAQPEAQREPQPLAHPDGVDAAPAQPPAATPSRGGGR